MSCLKFKSSKLNLLKYLVDQGLIDSEQFLDFEKIAANEDIYEFPFYPKQTRARLLSTKFPYSTIQNTKAKVEKTLRKVAEEYYGLVLEPTDKFFEEIVRPNERTYFKFNFELLDRIDARRKVLGLYDDKLMADTLRKDDKLYQQEGSSKQVKEGVPELFKSNPELANIGTPEQYSQYLDSIFPDSKVKDVVYHGTIFDFPSFSKKKLGRYTQAPSATQGFFFTNNKLVSDSYIKPERIKEQEWIYNQNKEFVEKYGKLTDISKVDNAIKELKELLEFQNNNIYNLRPNTPEYYSDSAYVIFKDSKDAKFNSYREEVGWKELEPQKTYRRFYDRRSNSYKFEEVSGEKLEILVNKLYKSPTKKDYKFNKNYLESSLSWMEYIKDLYEQGEDLPNLPIKFQWEIAENESYGNRELLNTYIINKYAEIGKTSYRKPSPITKNVILNLENPLTFDYEGEKYRSVSYYDKLKEANNKGNDGAILQNTYDSGFLKEDKYEANVFVAFEPEQIHILGNKQDIEGFKKFVNKTTDQVDYYREEDLDFFTEMFPSVEEQENIKAKEIALNMANRLASQTGLGYQVISAEEASEITSASVNPWNGEPAFFYEGRVYFVNNGFKLNQVLHEYGHPIVRAIYVENRTLFNNAYNTILNTPEGAEIFETVRSLYPEYTEDDINFQQEVFVRALEKAAVNKVNNIENSTGFKKFITNLLYGIKQLFKKLFGQGIKVSKLSETTTLDELADMLVGEDFILTTEIITEKEIVSYLRDNQKLYEDLGKVDDNTLNQTVNRYFSAVNNILSRVRNNKNYEDFVEAVTNEAGSNLIKDIYTNLKKAETLNLDERVKKFKDEVDKREKQVTSFVRGIVQTDILTKKVSEKLMDLSKMSDTKEVISRTFYYDLALRNWDKIIKESINNLVDNGLDTSSSLFTKLTDIKNRIEQSNRSINKIYKKGVGGVLFDVMSDLAESVDQTFEKKLQILKDKGASAKEIAKTEAEYKRLKLDRATVDDYLSGMRGDVNILSAYAESFSSSPDPIVSSLGVFFDNAYTEVDSIATIKAKKFYADLQKSLKAAGVSDKNITTFMKELVYKDQVLYRGKDNKVETFEKLVFLNPFKGYEAAIDKYQFDIEEAKNAGNLDEARKIAKDFRNFQKDYMHNVYLPEFYEKEKIYDSELGQIAYERKQNLLAEISDIDARIFEDLTEDDAFELKKELWKDYQQLASEYDANGMKKQGDELEIAKIEKQYRDQSRKFYEWQEIPGLFQFKLDEFKQDLLDKGLHPESAEFKDSLKTWMEDNTRVVIKPDFYEKKKEIINNIKKILSSSNQSIKDDLDISNYWNEILDLTKGFKDNDNQIEALELGSVRIQKIKELQEKIEDAKNDLANYTGLTPNELSTFFDLIRKRKAKDITEDELIVLDSLTAKKENKGLSTIQQEVLKQLYAELSELQFKEPTEYYIDTLNNLLSLQQVDEQFMPLFGESFMFTKKNLHLINDYFFRTNVIDKNPELKKWFYANHIRKEVYDAVEKEKVPVYERLYVWNITKPTTSEYYETYSYENVNPLTNTSNKESIYIDGVYRIPNYSFYKKSVKKEYRTKKEVGKTIDNRGNWLPRTLKDGAKDDRFINREYDKLKQNSPAKFKVLETITKYLLDFQEGKTRGSKLYLDVPRMRKLSSEVIGSQIGGLGDKVKSTVNSIKSQLMSSTDDFEFGLNYNDTLNLVRADMFDEEISTIPVRGLYRIDTNEVSLNTPYSIVEYMYSLEHQQKLIEINPTVQALQKVVNDPENAIKDLSKVNAYNYVNNGMKSFINKKGKNLRAEAINSLIEREMQGKTRIGILSEKSSAQKIIDGLQRQASFGMFSMNIFPSAIKNFGGALSNIIVEAGGGKYYNGKDLIKAAPKAFKTAMDLSTNIYKAGEKSVEYQLVEFFDPIKGRVQERLGSEFGRSVGSDLIDSVLMFGEGRRRTNGFWTSPRKWLQNEATLNSFFALMIHTKVPQVINGQTNYISYSDAWEKGPDGIIKLKEGISEDWAINGKEFKKVKNATQEVTNNLEGAYSQMDKTPLDRYAIWRLFSSLRRYFTRMFLNRFSSTRYNMRLGNLTEGYYRTFVESMPKLIMRISEGSFFMTEEEQYASKKMLTDFAVLGMLSFMIAYVFGYDPDDEDRFEKMRKRSGDMLSDDFNLGGWLVNHGLTSALGTRQEVLTFLNPKEYVNLVYSGGAPTLGPIVDRYKRLGTDGLHLLTNDNRAYYKRDVGPYDWQKEGSAKVWADVAYLFGLSGSQVDPIKSVKGYEYSIQR